MKASDPQISRRKRLAETQRVLEAQACRMNPTVETTDAKADLAWQQNRK
jgi:hypothetical protein